MSMLIINILITLITNIDGIEKSFKMGVSKCKLNTTYCRDGSIDSRSYLTRIEEKICPYCYFLYATRRVHCRIIIQQYTIHILLLRSIMVHCIGESIMFKSISQGVMHGGVRGGLIMVNYIVLDSATLYQARLIIN